MEELFNESAWGGGRDVINLIFVIVKEDEKRQSWKIGIIKKKREREAKR